MIFYGFSLNQTHQQYFARSFLFCLSNWVIKMTFTIMHQPFFFTTCNFCHNTSNPFFFTTSLRQCWHQIERNFPRYRYNERKNYSESFYMITHFHPHLKFIRLNLVISDEYYIYSYTGNVYKILVLSIVSV